MSVIAACVGLLALAHFGLIVPGRSVGSIRLGEQEKRALRGLPKSEVGDAAMGHFWYGWQAGYHGGALDIYAVRGPNDSARHPDVKVRQIRVTGDELKIRHGIGVGSPVSEIRRYFPHLTTIPIRNANEAVLDDVPLGIAFEIDKVKQECISVTVHRRGALVNREYSPWPFGDGHPFE